MQYIERSITNLNWETLVLVGCIVLITIVKALYPKRFVDLIHLPVSNNFFITKGKYEKLTNSFNFLLFANQILSLSLFSFLFYLKDSEANFRIFIQIVTFILVFVFTKVSVEKIIGNIFSIEKLIDQYTYEKLAYRNLLAILLLFTNLFLYYSVKYNQEILIIISAFFVLFNCIILVYSYKKHRSLLFSNFFYFLLYLCTLEISPYLILYKTIV